MSWIDAVLDPRGVLAVFGGEAPPLNGADVHSVSVHRDGPSVALVFDLRDYPEEPPAKWAGQGFTTVQLTLNCVGVENVRLTGWGTEVVADLSIQRVDERVTVRLDSPNATLTLDALAVDVQKVSAYQRETA